MRPAGCGRRAIRPPPGGASTRRWIGLPSRWARRRCTRQWWWASRRRSIRPAWRSPPAPIAATAAGAATSAPRTRWRSPICPMRRGTEPRSSRMPRCATWPRRPTAAGASTSIGWTAPGTGVVAADMVVLAAGTLGSTEILLRSREHGLAVSDRLGRSFSANGDIIAFGYGARLPVNAIGVGHPAKVEGLDVGACVSGQIEIVDAQDLAKSLTIQEGVLPSALAPLLPALFIPNGRLLGALKSLIAGVYKGPFASLQTFFAVSHDSGLGPPRAGGRPADAVLARRQGRAGLRPSRRGAGGPGRPRRRQLREEPAGRHHDGPSARDRASAGRLRHRPRAGRRRGRPQVPRVRRAVPAPVPPTCTTVSTSSTAPSCRARWASTRCSPSPRWPSAPCCTSPPTAASRSTTPRARYATPISVAAPGHAVSDPPGLTP